MKGGWSGCLEEQHWPAATQLSLAFSQLWTAWYFWLGSIIIIFFFPFKKYEAVGFLPRHTQVGLLRAADFPLGHLILLKKKGKKKKRQLPCDTLSKAQMAPLSPARPSKAVQPHYIPQNYFKRLQMEEQWHLSLANEGPAVTSKGELHSVILIPGYFSADFIPGVSGKMSSLCSVLLLQGWSDSPRVDMEPPESPWDCFNSHTSPGTSRIRAVLFHLSARNCFPWCLALLRREFYCICSTYNCAGPACQVEVWFESDKVLTPEF